MPQSAVPQSAPWRPKWWRSATVSAGRQLRRTGSSCCIAVVGGLAPRAEIDLCQFVMNLTYNVVPIGEVDHACFRGRGIGNRFVDAGGEGHQPAFTVS